MKNRNNKKVLQPEEIDEIIKCKDDSIFISYCWHDEGNKPWVVRLAHDLTEKGFKVVLDVFENLDVTELIIKGLACRHILIILTPKYLNNALVGRYDDSAYYNFPAFSIDNDEKTAEKTLQIIKVMYGLQIIKNQENEISKGENRIFSSFNAKKLKKWFDFEVYIFEDGYCLQELNMILMNEIYYEKIFILQRDGNNSLARYPIIDFRNEDDYNKSLSILCKALQSKDKKFRHIYEFGGFITEKDGQLFVYSNKGASDVSGTSLLNIQLWKLSDEYCFNILPSPNEQNELGLIYQISTKWYKIE